jgi:shikimate kinase
MHKITRRFFFIGIMGAGKSHWARKLGAHYGMPVFDTDDMIEEASGQTINDIFAGPKGEERFREMERKLLQETHWPDAAIISCGGGLPCFHHNMDFMLQSGIVVWLNPPVDELTKRLWKEKSHRPLLHSIENIGELANRLHGFLYERRPFYERAHIIIDKVPDEEAMIQKIDALARYHLSP